MYQHTQKNQMFMKSQQNINNLAITLDIFSKFKEGNQNV